LIKDEGKQEAVRSMQYAVKIGAARPTEGHSRSRPDDPVGRAGGVAG